MSGKELFLQARKINDQFARSQEDWKEMVRLYVAAGEQATGLSNIEIADCFKWSATIMLNDFVDKSPETYNEALLLYQRVETVKYLPNWYAVVDEHLLARIAPCSFGFDPHHLDVGGPELIDGMVDQLVRLKGTLEAVVFAPTLLHRSILTPVYTGRARSFAENTAAICAIDRLLDILWTKLDRVSMGEVGFTARGCLYHYCMPKTLDSFEIAKQSYRKAIKKLTLIDDGAAVSYTHLIDLLERPAFHGFGEVVDAQACAEEARALKEERDAWYKTDRSGRLMFWEARMIIGPDWRSSFQILQPPAESLQRAIMLFEKVLAESNNNLFKLEAAAMLGWTYQRRMPSTPENLRKMLANYTQVFLIDPRADGSIETDFTFCNMSRQDRINACSHMASINVRHVLQLMLPVCFFPERHNFPLEVRGELDQLKAFLASRTPNDPYGELVQRGFAEYSTFMSKWEVKLAQANPRMGKDTFLASAAESVGRTILEHAGTSEGASAVKKKEEELHSKFDIVQSLYDDEAMGMFCAGFSTAFSEVYIASMAVNSGQVSINTGNLGVQAMLVVLSMLPLIGGVAPALVDAGYSAYVEEKMQSSAKFMTTTFRMTALLEDAVLKALCEVQRQQLQEINELEGNSGKIVTGLFAQLQGKLESLRELIAKQPDQPDLEKLAAQVAMDIIKREIYSGRLRAPEEGKKIVTPQQVADRLVAATLQAVAQLHAEQEVHVQRGASAKSSPKRSEKARATEAPASRPASQQQHYNASSQKVGLEVESARLLTDPPSRGCPCSIM
jgi:hypothetical protein